MSTFDRVKNAKSAQDAMLAIAHGIDVILGKFDEANASWDVGEWSNEGPPVPESYSDPGETVLPFDVSKLDTNDPRVKEALSRLQEGGQKLDPTEKRATEEHDMRDGTILELPTASDELKEARKPFAEAVFTDDEYELKNAYVKGGPMWLYVYDRDFVMSLPVEMRKAMVADWELISTTEAQEMGRDILKNTEVQGAPDVWTGA